jgi:hypothetical protein
MEIDESECLREAGYTQEEIDEYIRYKHDDSLSKINEETGCTCLSDCQNKLETQLPNLDKIDFIPDPKNSFLKIIYNTKDLSITTPRIYVPFGIDSYYKNWSINFEIKNKNCEGIKQFKEFLMSFDDLILNKLNVEHKQLNTQFKIHNNFNMEFYGRIRNQYGKCQCIIEDKRKLSHDKFINVFKFPEKVFVKAVMSVNGIWKLNNMFCYKYVIDKLTIVD